MYGLLCDLRRWHRFFYMSFNPGINSGIPGFAIWIPKSRDWTIIPGLQSLPLMIGLQYHSIDNYIVLIMWFTSILTKILLPGLLWTIAVESCWHFLLYVEIHWNFTLIIGLFEKSFWESFDKLRLLNMGIQISPAATLDGGFGAERVFVFMYFWGIDEVMDSMETIPATLPLDCIDGYGSYSDCENDGDELVFWGRMFPLGTSFVPFG